MLLPDVPTERMPDRPADRQGVILAAAFQAFATYGFRRTTMDDIAAGAGMSRSALYLHYRNKEDIFRSLSQQYFAQAVTDFAAALATEQDDPAQTLAAAFAAKDGRFMEVVLGSPHGSELLDAGFAISSDLAAAGEAQLEALLAEWITQHGGAEDLGPATEVAATMMAALKGLKLSARSLAEYRAAQARLARMFARALAPAR